MTSFEVLERTNGRTIVGQQLPALLVVTVPVRRMLLRVVTSCYTKFETG